MPARFSNIGVLIALIILSVVNILFIIGQLDAKTAAVLGGLAVAIILK